MAEPEAQYQEAMTLLANRGQALDLKTAAGLIESAAAAGHLDAIECRALFEARGLDRPSDWDKALDSLACAAALGSESAQQQLILLADDRFDAEAAGGAEDWDAIRSRIAIAPRLKAKRPSGRTLSADPLVHAINGFASTAECQWLVGAAGRRLERATVYGGSGAVDPGRSNSYALFDLANGDLITEMIRARIADEISAPAALLEVPQVLHYAVGQEFVPHFDFLDPNVFGEEIARLGQRAATFLIYLNENFEGGETSFPRLGIAHRGKAGDALVFGNLDRAGQPNFRAEHAGLPPTNGEKWVFSQWVRDRPPTT